MAKETKELSGAKRWFVFICVCLSCVTAIGDNFIIPVVNSIFTAFPEDELVTNYILTGPLLIGMIVGFIAGKVLEYVPKKITLVVCLIIYMLSAAFGAAIMNVWYMAAMRTLVGLATGFVMPASMAIVSEMFPDDAERAKAMGFFTAFMSLSAAVASMVAGVVAVDSTWTAVFKLYWITLPIVILVMVFAPNFPAPRKIGQKTEVVEADGTVEEEKVNWWPLVGMCASLAVFCIVYSVPFMQIGVYIIECGIGDESFVGVAAAIMSVANMVFSFLFGWTYSKFKGVTITICYAVLALAVFLLYLFPSVAMVFICSCLLGVAYGTGSSYFMNKATLVVPPSRVSFSLACENSFLSFGSFLSTYAVTFISAMIGAVLLVDVFPVLAGIAAVGFILSLVNVIRNRNAANVSEQGIGGGAV